MNKEEVIKPTPLMEEDYDRENDEFIATQTHESREEYGYLYLCKSCGNKIFLTNYCSECGQKLR